MAQLKWISRGLGSQNVSFCSVQSGVLCQRAEVLHLVDIKNTDHSLSNCMSVYSTLMQSAVLYHDVTSHSLQTVLYFCI